MAYPIIEITVPTLNHHENLIKLRPLTIHLEALQAALDRLQTVDNLFSSNSREYLIEHQLNKITGQLEFHNGLPIPTRTGICGLIRDRFNRHIEFQPRAILNFLNYLDWRFFDDKMFPLSTPLSDFPDAVRASMNDLMDTYGSSIKQRMKDEPERFIYEYHHHPLGIAQYPLGALDPKSLWRTSVAKNQRNDRDPARYSVLSSVLCPTLHRVGFSSRKISSAWICDCT